MYWNDCRYAGRDRASHQRLDEDRMVLQFEDCDGQDREIPAVWELCDTCRGKGSHVNPSIDDHGLTREDFDRDPDFAQDYLRGAYDVTCQTCNGKRVVPVPDTLRASEELLEAYEEVMESWALDAAEDRRARAMGY